MNVELTSGFTQVCVWPGTIVGADKVTSFVDFAKQHFGIRAQYLEEIKTAPDLDTGGHPVDGTGGRNDLFFAVHDEDALGFIGPRLLAGIRWFDDIVGNGDGRLYPKRVLEYQCWGR